VGRKKNYDRDELIDKAMQIFREHGFAGTSSQMLVDGLGVNRFSLYAEFDNKQGLFDAAIERYNDSVVERNFGPLEAPTAEIKEIRALLMFFASASKSTAYGLGCLLCNSAVEFGPTDPSGSEFVQSYFKRISKAFYKALYNAKNKDLLRDTITLKKEADFFTATTLGLFVMIRAKAPAKVIENAAIMAIEHLEGLCA
jgi:TetR/AcrR family transcriptional repressor of nem operon